MRRLHGAQRVGTVLLSWVVWAWVAWAQADPALITRGEKVYADKKCALCHMTKGKGGKTASDLSAAGARREALWLKQFMKDPKAMDPKAAKMLPFKGSEEELEAVVAYLASLK